MIQTKTMKQKTRITKGPGFEEGFLEVISFKLSFKYCLEFLFEIETPSRAEESSTENLRGL